MAWTRRAQFARHGIAIVQAEFEDRVTSRLVSLDQIITTSAESKPPIKKGASMGIGQAGAGVWYQAKWWGSR